MITEEVLGELHTREYRTYKAIAWKVVWNEAIAEEVVQTAFLLAWSRREQFRGECSVAGWVAGIVRNKAIDIARYGAATRDSAMQNERVIEVGHLAPRLACSQNASRDDAHLAQDIRRLYVALAKLNTRDRDAIRARWLGDGERPTMTQAQRVILHRAQKRLREKLT